VAALARRGRGAPARQPAGIGVVGAVATLFVRRLAAPRAGTLVGIGVLWLGLSVAFELLFGHYFAGASWEALFADYDVGQGRLWPFVLLATLIAPWLCARALEGMSRRHDRRGSARNVRRAPRWLVAPGRR
jgi:hypothetical protein